MKNGLVKKLLLAGTILGASMLGLSGCTINHMDDNPNNSTTKSSYSSSGSSENSSDNSSSSTGYSSSSYSSSSSSQSSVPLFNISISGNLQDSEAHTNTAGEIKVYDSLSNLIKNITTSDGNYNITLPYSFSEYRLKAKPNGNYYFRTVHIDGKSGTNNLTVRAVPYPTFCSYGDFRKFMEEINMSKTIVADDGKEFGLRKSIIRNVEILKNHPKGNFTIDEQNFMSNKIKDVNDIRKYVIGDNINVQVDGDNNSSPNGNHFSMDSLGNITYIEPKWGIIFKDETIAGQGKTQTGYSNSMLTGIINTGITRIGTVNDTIVSHELGHELIVPDGENYILSPSYTIMCGNGNSLTKPGVADEKAGKIIYELTFNPRETSEDILGTN